MERIKIDLGINIDNELEKQMYEEYLACPAAIKHIIKLGIPEDVVIKNISKIYEMVLDINYCKNCPGIDKCAKDNPLVCSTITYKDNYVDRNIAPCKKFLEKMLVERQFIIRDFDDDRLNVSLASLDKSKDRTEALNSYLNFREKGINNWIYIKGSVGSGRSYFASVIASDIARKKKGPIVFMNSKRIAELNNDFYTNKERFHKMLEEISNVPVLVIDDFGNEPKTDNSRDAIVLSILNERASKKLFTIFTSDFSINEIVTLYSTSKAGEIRAKQLGSIIRALAKKEIDFGSLSIY